MSFVLVPLRDASLLFAATALLGALVWSARGRRAGPLGFAVVVSAVFVALLALWRTLVIFGVPALWSVSLGEREAPALTLALAGLAMLPLGLALGDRVRRAHRPVRPEEVDVDVETPFDDDVDEGPESPPPRA
ncbi:MAG TPA: hypothetical protein RMH85_28890 [Polyangiaceae bacterium LLY-WYZ-15_(1-7)]|nr:hypothetical protein [Myxococcales bacterium]MAT27246.1 hypothetical protein [Sandaracinus sp.]HJL05542.1 hypothetical protein [Polyangiaceae bacterium LLY-WYZ-15_(1-7)]MBJ72564.1 hypothetical protein [Sandaracinus sp.]HJL12532.1 hypothetical protein [Polyangiaceae bacterium LLY-WYZ-15_(1-7)]